jgi:REP element-mobilizing transposase RayT
MSNQRYRNIYLDNHSHFCTASTVAFLPLVADDHARHLILKSWDKQRSRYNVLIEGFVIMPEHTHTLIRGLAGDVRKFIQYSLGESSREIRLALQLRAKSGDATAAQWLSTITARANGGAAGKVWKERFRCFPMDHEARSM